MMFCVHGFSQRRAVELGLSNDDLVVLRWFVIFRESENMQRIMFESDYYYWVNYSAVVSDLPILGIKKQSVRRGCFDNLCSAGVLKKTVIKDSKGSFSYFAYGLNYSKLEYLTKDTSELEIEPSGKKIRPVGKGIPTPQVKSDRPGVGKKIPTKDSNTKLNSNTTNSIKQESQITFNDIINNFTQYEPLRQALGDFLRIRKLMKAPLTNSSLQKLLTNKQAGLFDLCGGDNQIATAIVNQSVMNSWRGFFPLRKTPSSTSPGTIDKKQTSNPFLNIALGGTNDEK